MNRDMNEWMFQTEEIPNLAHTGQKNTLRPTRRHEKAARLLLPTSPDASLPGAERSSCHKCSRPPLILRYHSYQHTYPYVSFFSLLFFFAHFNFQASEQAVVTGVVPSTPRFLPSICIAHRVQQSHCSSIVHRVSVANSRSRAFRKSICPNEFIRVCTRRGSKSRN